MVQFAKRLLAARYEPWGSYYLNYKRLKKVLKYSPELFEDCLEEEVEKVVLYFLYLQGQFASSLLELKSSSSKESSSVEHLKTEYNRIGQEIVQFVYFCELNTTGLRKILKKHDKKISPPLSKTYLDPQYHHQYQNNTTDSHLQQLFHYGGIAALVATIRAALLHLEKQKQKQLLLQENNGDHNQLSYGSLSSSVVTTIESQNGALITTPTKQTHYTRDDESDVYEPILEKIETARRRLLQSTEYVRAIAAQALIFDDDSFDEDDASAEKLFNEIRHGQTPRKAQTKNLWISSFLNLLSTFLYMTNYYIIAPTSGEYATKLGCTASMSGMIIGMTPCAALLSAVLYSWWANHSYKNALLFASVCSLMGNILYALALPLNNVWYIIFGRLLNGFGGARAINRRYIADTCRREDRTAASAAFVTAGALGMAAGPAIASIIGLATKKTNDVYYVYWTAETAPGWIMFLLWSIYLAAAYHYFEDPMKGRNLQKQLLEMTTTSSETKKLLPSNNNNDNNIDQNEDTFVDDDVESTKYPQHSTPTKKDVPTKQPLYRNVPVMATLGIYFVLKLVLESLLSSTAMITKFYFHWDDSISGLFLALLGLFMFPANMALAQLSRVGHEDRYIIFLSLIGVFLGCVGIIHYLNGYYSPLQFIFFGLCIFISTNILEGVNMSLLSKVIPKEYSAKTFNSGFLATEAGTLGRAIGDMLIYLTGSFAGIQNLLNVTFAPLSILVFLTTLTTWKYYPLLKNKHDF